jgi:hypothetical protein
LPRVGAVDSLRHVLPPPSLSDLTRPEVEALLAGQREEIARLEGLKGRPDIAPGKPSCMDRATGQPGPAAKDQKRRRGKVAPRFAIETRVVRAAVPEGSPFKGHEPFLVQDLMISATAMCYQHARWVTSGGQPVLAPLPEGVDGHFGPELRRFVLTQYRPRSIDAVPHRGVPARAGCGDLQAPVAAPADGQTGKLLRGSVGRPARRAGDIALPLIASLAAQPRTEFADQTAWLAHLDRLGFTALDVTPDPVRVATEGALWGSIHAHGLLSDGVMLSDDAGQFNVGQAIRSHLSQAHRLRSAGSLADAAARQQGGAAGGTRPATDAAEHQRFGARHPMLCHTAKAQRGNPRRSRVVLQVDLQRIEAAGRHHHRDIRRPGLVDTDAQDDFVT